MRKTQGKEKEEGVVCRLSPHRAGTSGVTPACSAVEHFVMSFSQLQQEAWRGAAEVGRGGALWCSEAISIAHRKASSVPVL